MNGSRALCLLGLTIGLLAAGPAMSDSPVAPLHIAAEDWPPYVTSALPDNGVAVAAASTVFARLGNVLEVDYFPWKRTMEFGLHNPRYAGFMAVWRTPEREKLCYFSSPIASTQTVLAYLKEAPLQASSLSELKGVRIGTVGGYANDDEFETQVRKGALQVEEGVNDETNLRKLLSKRFAAIVIEKRVLRYLLSTPQFRTERDRIGFAGNLFRERPVHICFKRSPEGQARQRAFNAAARDLDLPKFERDYWRRLGDEALPGG
ncbi:substrate-binding periplasmic protein [Pseudoduganella sp. RAF19]|uniref:substrate-binding periplasmic protein n=1 Tax=Pseudoduganella sp. RAF19 TaxID=3233052 RepID=UPI003F95AFDD